MYLKDSWLNISWYILGGVYHSLKNVHNTLRKAYVMASQILLSVSISKRYYKFKEYSIDT